MKQHRVFVYGTLKKGYGNHHLLADSQFLGEAYTLETFKMYSQGFPVIFLSDDPSAASVYGEVYDIDDATLKRLDALEAEGTMYNRRPINVVLAEDTAETIDANVHVYIGNSDYWECDHGITIPEYSDVNIHDELEWRV